MPRLTHRQIAETLKAACGHLFLAAEKLGCPAEDLQERVRRNPRLEAIVRESRGRMIDTAEAALHRAILDGESWAIRFALTTLGKDRGYSTDESAGDLAPKSFLERGKYVTVAQVIEKLHENKDFAEFIRARRIVDVKATPVEETLPESGVAPPP